MLDSGDNQVGLKAANSQLLCGGQELKAAGVRKHAVFDVIGGDLSKCADRRALPNRGLITLPGSFIVALGQGTEGGISLDRAVGQPTADPPRLAAVGGGAIECDRPCHGSSLSPPSPARHVNCCLVTLASAVGVGVCGLYRVQDAKADESWCAAGYRTLTCGAVNEMDQAPRSDPG